MNQYVLGGKMLAWEWSGNELVSLKMLWDLFLKSILVSISEVRWTLAESSLLDKHECVSCNFYLISVYVCELSYKNVLSLDNNKWLFKNASFINKHCENKRLEVYWSYLFSDIFTASLWLMICFFMKLSRFKIFPLWVATNFRGNFAVHLTFLTILSADHIH